MSTISKEHGDRLFWLGRYTERFFITLRSLDKLYDKMIDNKFGYREYLAYFSLPDTYKDSPDFIHSFLYDINNSNSAAYSLERAYDNGIVLREEISSKTLSFLQMAKDTLISSQGKASVRLRKKLNFSVISFLTLSSTKRALPQLQQLPQKPLQ